MQTERWRQDTCSMQHAHAPCSQHRRWMGQHAAALPVPRALPDRLASLSAVVCPAAHAYAYARDGGWGEGESRDLLDLRHCTYDGVPEYSINTERKEFV
jgi:hypothetical protein